jgi:hypothetical protein
MFIIGTIINSIITTLQVTQVVEFFMINKTIHLDVRFSFKKSKMVSYVIFIFLKKMQDWSWAIIKQLSHLKDDKGKYILNTNYSDNRLISSHKYVS